MGCSGPGCPMTGQGRGVTAQPQDFLAAHVGLEDLGDLHAAVGLEIVLQQGDEHPGRGHAGVVEGMGQADLALFVPVADLQAAGLGVAQLEQEQTLKVLRRRGLQASMRRT